MILTKPKLEKLPFYLSPSSLWAIENTPCTFYLERLIQDCYEREPQSPPSAVGSAFDFFIKIHLAKHMSSRLNVKGNVLKMEDLRNVLMRGMHSSEQKALYQGKSVNDILWQTNVQPHMRTEAAGAGKLLFDEYNNAMPEDWEYRYDDIEIHSNYDLHWKGINIPLLGKADASVKLPSIWKDRVNTKSVPLDWKVKGYGSQASPTKGYFDIWDKGEWKHKPHKDYYCNIPMDSIDVNYATQLCTYGWMLGISPGTPFPAYIEQIVIRNNSIRVALYEGIITREFQLNLAERYYQAWTKLRSGRFLQDIPCDVDLVKIIASSEGWW